MKFIAMWSLKAGVDQTKIAEAVGRRAEHKFPTGMSLIAEYWSAKTSPTVISIFEADNAAALMINSTAWVDVFTVDVFAVTTFEEGLQSLTKHFAGG
jgi:hypothetical protein